MRMGGKVVKNAAGFDLPKFFVGSLGRFGVLAELGLTDLVGTADTRSSHYRKPLRHASYLLVSDVAAVKRFEILAEPEVSDHRALILDI